MALCGFTMTKPLEHTAQYWIDHLELAPHPEGGFFRETYRSAGSIESSTLPDCFSTARAFSTAIYFLLRSHEHSAFHRIASDELWHFHTGSPLTVHCIHPGGDYARILLGPDPDAGQVFQGVVPAGVWFGATVDQPESYSLVGCTVAPGFDFADFELARRSDLITRCPQHQAIIERLTDR
jgi:uncharacterized protein